MELETLIKFLDENDLNLESPYSDTFLIHLGIFQLKTLAVFLQKQNAHFEALIVSKKMEDFELKYFFYLGIKDKLLVLETVSKSDTLIPSLSSCYPAIYTYEKESSERFSLVYEDSLPAKPPYDPAPEFSNSDTHTIDIPVGPIHAGVIEPGHFHFSCQGEHITKLEISLGYLHKNIEVEFENKSVAEGLELSQNICGDSIVAYSLAYAQAVEKIQNISVIPKAQYTRMILLELERFYNHIGDIGGIINDTGFSFSHAGLSTQKEKILRLNKEIFAHRFLKDSIKVGGVTKILDQENINQLRTSLTAIYQDFNKIIDLTFKHKTVLDRLSKTGHLSSQTAKHLSITGLVGKASGISFDSRRDLSFALYEKIKFHPHLRREGDVYARFNLRIDEIKESFKIIDLCLERILLEDTAQADLGLSSRLSAWSMVEAARGPVFIYVEFGDNGLITRAKLRDVSKHNWKGLEYAVLKNIVPDFPLCNKSFSLAYAGTDM